jgi:hypothetical protein
MMYVAADSMVVQPVTGGADKSAKRNGLLRTVERSVLA